METVGAALTYIDPECHAFVQEALKEIQALVVLKNDEQLNSLFGLCAPKKLNYSSVNEIATFYDALIDSWMGATQYNKVGNNSQLTAYCRTMTNATLGDPLSRYAKWYKENVVACVDHDYEEMIKLLKEDQWESQSVQQGSRQWLWQTCTEFAYYQSTDSKRQPFGHTIDLHYLEEAFCKAPFNISTQLIKSGVKKTNRRYRGLKPKVTNVFFLNGSIDPWHRLSVFKHDLNKSSPSRFITGTSHCYDMYENSPDDPPELIKARQDVSDALSTWLKNS